MQILKILPNYEKVHTVGLSEGSNAVAWKTVGLWLKAAGRQES